MTKIGRLRFNLEDMLAYFDNFTERDLAGYDRLVHDGSIAEIIECYLFLLEKAVTTGRYTVSFTKHIGSAHEEVIDGQKRDVGHYTAFLGFIERNVYPELIPEQFKKGINEEYELVTRVLDGFKKIRWAFDREIHGDRSEAPPLDHPYKHYVQETYLALIQLSQLHESSRVRPFIMGGPNRPGIKESNQERNILYYFANRLFEHSASSR